MTPPTSACWRSIAFWLGEPVAGITETVPTYRSLLVHYDPVRIDFGALSEKLAVLAQLPVPAVTKTRAGASPWSMAASTASTSKMSPRHSTPRPDDIVARHTAGDYRVAMIDLHRDGPISAALQESLHMSRRQNPRLLTPAGTISIGGIQTGVQCLAGPSGWHLLGQTAVRTYQLHRDPTFLPGARRLRHVLFGGCQDLRGAGSRGRTRRDRRRIDILMSKLVISAIGPSSSVQDGGRFGAPALRSYAKRRDGPVGPRYRQLSGR